MAIDNIFRVSRNKFHILPTQSKWQLQIKLVSTAEFSAFPFPPPAFSSHLLESGMSYITAMNFPGVTTELRQWQFLKFKRNNFERKWITLKFNSIFLLKNLKWWKTIMVFILFFASYGMQSLSSHQNRNRTIELFSRSLLPVITVNQVSNSLVPFYLSKRFCYTANQMDTISKIWQLADCCIYEFITLTVKCRNECDDHMWNRCGPKYAR